MGYKLKIGEAQIRFSEDYVKIDCAIVEHENAPAYGEPTDRENQRWPSYTNWAQAMSLLGMTDVMFNERNGGKGSFEWNGIERQPLIAEHPGAMPITKEHVEYVENALSIYKQKYPDHIAQYPPPKIGAKPIFEGSNEYRSEDLSDDPIYDSNLCRGEWLAYWLRWALENCKHPVFVNS